MILTGVGVWAATSTAAKFGSNVSFKATNITGTVGLSVGGDVILDGSATTVTNAVTKFDFTDTSKTDIKLNGTAQTVYTVENSTATVAASAVSTTVGTIYLQFKDTDNSGAIETDEKVSLTFTFTNTHASNVLYYKISITNPDSAAVTAAVKSGDSLTGSAAVGTTGNTATATVEFAVSEVQYAITAITGISFTVELSNTSLATA